MCARRPIAPGVPALRPHLLLRLAILTIVVGMLGVAAPAAAAPPAIGVGEHSAHMFSDPHWQLLATRDVRLVVGWNVLRSRRERRELDHYMAAAHAARAELLVSFGRSRHARGVGRLPTVAQFTAQFERFRTRYPWVRQYVTWNEANHCSQPTCHRPERVAEFFDAMRRRCPRCTIVGADVLDTKNMTNWVKRFRKATRARRLIWGLHNYVDANRLQSSGTRALLRTTRGPVWFTETGGVVWRENARNRIRFPSSVPHAARATRWVFRLAALSPRVKRVYFYNWTPGPTWDSGLMDRRGRPRPAYEVVRSWLTRRGRTLDGGPAASSGQLTAP
jgi:hypothetical protein